MEFVHYVVIYLVGNIVSFVIAMLTFPRKGEGDQAMFALFWPIALPIFIWCKGWE